MVFDMVPKIPYMILEIVSKIQPKKTENCNLMNAFHFIIINGKLYYLGYGILKNHYGLGYGF